MLRSKIILKGSLGQARSQDLIWGGAEPPKSGPFGPKKWTFWTSPHSTLLQKLHFWQTLWPKVNLLPDLGVRHTPMATGLHLGLNIRLVNFLDLGVQNLDLRHSLHLGWNIWKIKLVEHLTANPAPWCSNFYSNSSVAFMLLTRCEDCIVFLQTWTFDHNKADIVCWCVVWQVSFLPWLLNQC